jgi:hypothetical protein
VKPKLRLEILISEPADPLIWSVWGGATVHMLTGIQDGLLEWLEDQKFPVDQESVCVLAQYVTPEYHEDRVAIQGYWDLTPLNPADDQGLNFDDVADEVESNGWAWTCRATRDTSVEAEEHRGKYIARIWTVEAGAPGVHYLGIEYGATRAGTLAAALAQVHASAEALE